jgi:hypothetical protein
MTDADDGGQSYRNERLGEHKALFVTTLSLAGGAQVRFLDKNKGLGGACSPLRTRYLPSNGLDPKVSGQRR